MAHKLHLSNDFNIQVRSPLLLSLVLRQELITKDRYPNNITSDTVVPGWAYLDVTTTDKFEAVSATNAKDLPGSTVGNYETPTSCPPPPTSPSPNNSINTLTIICIAIFIPFGLVILVVLILSLTGRIKMPSLMFSHRTSPPDSNQVVDKPATPSSAPLKDQHDD